MHTKLHQNYFLIPITFQQGLFQFQQSPYLNKDDLQSVVDSINRVSVSGETFFRYI